MDSPRKSLLIVRYIFAIGGAIGVTLNFVMDVDRYDPVSNSWTPGVASMPVTGRRQFCAVEVNDVLWLMGGYK